MSIRVQESVDDAMIDLIHSPRLFFFLNSYFYPGWHPYGQAGWLSTTQVIKGSLLTESGMFREGEKEIVL